MLPHSPTAQSSFVGDPTIGLTYSGIVALPESMREPELLGAAVTQKEAPLASDGVSEVAGAIASPDSFALTGPSGLATGAPFGTGGPGPVDATASGDETTTAAAALPCDPSQSTLFCVYTVESGDTLSSIAAKFGLQTTEDVASWELLVQSNRPDIVSEDDLLQIGQQLRIPTQQGVIHEVVSDETLSDIAGDFGVSTDDITAVAANAISDPNQVQRGQILLIPNPTQFSAFGGGGGQVLPVGPTSTAGFIWPTSGPITSYFGPGHPLGIDIGLYANPSSPIIAALPGTVVFAGGNPCCSYGYYVVVDHANGFETLYAHLSEIDVSVGEQVAQGEVLGIAGTTGYSTGVHLHFEVHKNGSVVDPLQYLP